jgi:very-short-patch-repair endonuclease
MLEQMLWQRLRCKQIFGLQLFSAELCQFLNFIVDFIVSQRIWSLNMIVEATLHS